MFNFCTPFWSEETPEIDWHNMSSECIVELTLRRDYLLVLLQDLVDSQTAQQAEAALKAMNAAVREDEEVYLQFLERAGTLRIIEETLNRAKGRPSSSAAAPLLYKFAVNGIGYIRSSESGEIIA